MDRQTLSIMKACEAVGVSRRTIYNWISSGKVQYVRTAGGLLRVLDTKPGPGGIAVHSAVVQSGEVRAGDEAHAEVDEVRRSATARVRCGQTAATSSCRSSWRAR